MIRLMEERDIPQVAELERLCFSTPWSENSLKESLVRPEYLFLVEETDGKVTAYGGLLQVMEEGDVTNIAVHPQHRLKGSGQESAAPFRRDHPRFNPERRSFLCVNPFVP